MKKPVFNRQERTILKELYKERRPMSIKELSEQANICWFTTRKYLDKLEKKDIIKTLTETKTRDNKTTYKKFFLNLGVLK